MKKIHPSRTADGIREIADERALSVSRLYGRVDIQKQRQL